MKYKVSSLLIRYYIILEFFDFFNTFSIISQLLFKFKSKFQICLKTGI